MTPELFCRIDKVGNAIPELFCRIDKVGNRGTEQVICGFQEKAGNILSPFAMGD
jgi:hypothetical protein